MASHLLGNHPAHVDLVQAARARVAVLPTGELQAHPTALEPQKLLTRSKHCPSSPAAAAATVAAACWSALVTGPLALPAAFDETRPGNNSSRAVRDRHHVTGTLLILIGVGSVSVQPRALVVVQVARALQPSGVGAVTRKPPSRPPGRVSVGGGGTFFTWLPSHEEVHVVAHVWVCAACA